MKRFSPVRDTQRASQSYMKKRRGSGDRREIEMIRRRGGGVKRRETNLACDHLPKCSPQPRIPKEIQSWVEKRRGREEIEMTWGEKGESKGEEGNQASNHTPK